MIHLSKTNPMGLFFYENILTAIWVENGIEKFEF